MPSPGGRCASAGCASGAALAATAGGAATGGGALRPAAARRPPRSARGCRARPLRFGGTRRVGRPRREHALRQSSPAGSFPEESAPAPPRAAAPYGGPARRPRPLPRRRRRRPALASRDPAGRADRSPRSAGRCAGTGLGGATLRRRSGIGCSLRGPPREAGRPFECSTTHAARADRRSPVVAARHPTGGARPGRGPARPDSRRRRRSRRDRLRRQRAGLRRGRRFAAAVPVPSGLGRRRRLAAHGAPLGARARAHRRDARRRRGPSNGGRGAGRPCGGARRDRRRGHRRRGQHRRRLALSATSARTCGSLR